MTTPATPKYVTSYAGAVGFVDRYRVERVRTDGRPARPGDIITVRVGKHGVFCCMTCRVVDCEHVEEAKACAEALAAKVQPQPLPQPSTDTAA